MKNGKLPPRVMKYSKHNDIWTWIIPEEMGIFEVMALGQFYPNGLPIPGDIIDIAKCDDGWKDSVEYLDIQLDENHNVVRTGWLELNYDQRKSKRLSRINKEIAKRQGENS